MVSENLRGEISIPSSGTDLHSVRLLIKTVNMELPGIGMEVLELVQQSVVFWEARQGTVNRLQGLMALVRTSLSPTIFQITLYQLKFMPLIPLGP